MFWNLLLTLCCLMETRQPNQGDSNRLAGLPCGSAVKSSRASAGDVGLTPGLLGRSGEGDGNPLQYSCLGNPLGLAV